MSPAAYMVVGGIFGGLILAIAIVIGETSVPAIFGAGALFGKGYGVWEERTRRTLKEKGG